MITPAKVTAQNGGGCHALGEGYQYKEDYTNDASSHAEVATVAGKAKDRQKHLSIDAGTHFTCFTSTKVLVLMRELRAKPKDRQKQSHLSINADTHFTCFTRTKVHILTEAVALVN
jgi:hypothetical protein